MQAQQRAQFEHEAITIFQAADTSQGSDGSLSRSEIKKYLKQDRGAKDVLLTGGSWGSFFGEIDADATGKVGCALWMLASLADPTFVNVVMYM